MLFVLHQLNDVLQQSEILEASAHGFGLGVKSDKLTDCDRQKLISVLNHRLVSSLALPALSVITSTSPVLDISFIDVEMALLVVLVQQDRQDDLSMLEQ